MKKKITENFGIDEYYLYNTSMFFSLFDASFAGLKFFI